MIKNLSTGSTVLDVVLIALATTALACFFVLAFYHHPPRPPGGDVQ